MHRARTRTINGLFLVWIQAALVVCMPAFVSGSVNDADLVVTKSASPDPVIAGNNLTYNITVTNNGPSDAQNVQLSDVLPVNTTFVSFTKPNDWGSSTPMVGRTGSVTGLKTSLPAGTTANFTLVVKIGPSVPEGAIITNTACVSGSTTDPFAENDCATTISTVVTQADLVVTKTDSPNVVLDGNDLTYTITVTNNGPSDAQNVQLSDVLPVNTTFVSFTKPNDWGSSTPMVGRTGSVTGLKTSLPAGTTANFTLVVNVNAGTADGTNISNTATVTSSTTDPSPSNNSNTEESSVTTTRDVAVSKADSPDPIGPGEALTYTVTVTNTQVHMLKVVTLTDVVPDGTTFVSFTAPAGWTSETPPVGGTGTVTTTGDLSGGAQAVFTLVVKVLDVPPCGLTITNTASAPIPTDPTPADNSATATTTLVCDDGDACTRDCNEGVCMPIPLWMIPRAEGGCDDGNPCTLDICDRRDGTFTCDNRFLPGNDTDRDTIPNHCDNCIFAPNRFQTDTDNDGFGNACDADKNNDCVVNRVDLEMLIAAFGTDEAECDLNGDGIVGMPDLAILLRLFGQPPGPSGLTPVCVPDPL